ncbi:MAG TPA: GNAT family N-acetyltransferase [Thermoanaerobaculia bacterium]|nr:GNAT family N-acetyltransferase [Thermoanaerobaculia bacterium]
MSREPEVRIETMRTEDRDAAHALLIAFKEESQSRSPVYDGLRPEYYELLGQYLDDYHGRRDCTILVAKAGGVPVGLIMGTMYSYLPIYKIERMGYIAELFVAPKFRRQGIGTSLLRETERWFRDQGAKFARIETITAYEHNQELYKSLGYHVFLVELRRKLD